MAEQGQTPTRELPRMAYQDVWAAAGLEVIQSLTGDTRWGVAAAGPETTEPIEMVGFVELAGELAGIQQIRLHRGAGRGWAQLVAPPPPEEAPRARIAALDDGEREALAEVVRRICAAAALGLRAQGWGQSEVNLRHLGPLRRTVEAAEGTDTLAFQLPDGPRIEFTMALDSALKERIRQKLAGESAPPTERTPVGERQPVTSTARFDMLLDVELDVTLRFGNRQMLLHDVAELSPGSVLELDRQIDDPVELLVSGKTIAWGEVVVVDGNYGLRIQRLVHRRERLAAMEGAR
jgi:flagellar motor switch protein FliN